MPKSHFSDTVSSSYAVGSRNPLALMNGVFLNWRTQIKRVKQCRKHYIIGYTTNHPEASSLKQAERNYYDRM